MASSPKTIVVYDLKGSTNFVIPFDYLARKFITVTLLGVDRKELILNTDYRFTTSTQITLNDGLPVGYTNVEIARYTSATDRLVNFYDGSILRAYDLNLSQIQTLHVAEEARDLTGSSIGVDANGNLDARGRQIVNIGGAVDGRGAVNLSQLRQFDASTWHNANNSRTYAAASKASELASKVSELAAKQSELKSKTSETKSKTSETNAKTSETNAKTSETNLKTSETNSKTSETNSKTSETKSKTSETKSKTSELAAKTSELAAKTSETNSKTSETKSKTSETNSKTSETNSKTSETNSKTSELAAKTSETKSKTSETNSKTSETKSKTSETNSKTSETNAKTSELAAKQAVIDVSDRGSLPVGTILMFAHKGIPIGFIDLCVANPTFNVKTYPELALLFPNGSLPSMLNRYPKGGALNTVGAYGSWQQASHGHNINTSIGSYDYGSKTTTHVNLDSIFGTTSSGNHTHPFYGGNGKGGTNFYIANNGQLGAGTIVTADQSVGQGGNHNHTVRVAFGNHVHSVAIGAHSHSATSTINSMTGSNIGNVIEVDRTILTFAIKAEGAPTTSQADYNALAARILALENS